METIFDDPSTRESLAKIEEAFLTIASDNTVLKEFPDLEESAGIFRRNRKNGYNDETEISFLNLYCQIHSSGSSYSEKERKQLDGRHGYFNHPGGISPLLKCEPYINEGSIVADLGAGNGLQGLLFQFLYPHLQTEQVELSAEMIRIGKLFQQALQISDNKINWINDNILNVDLDHIDFLYLYRPSKPIRNGVELYYDLQAKLNNRHKSITIFSIADCLKDYLADDYHEFYNDGHLTCFQLER